MLSHNWLYCVNKQLNIVSNKVVIGQIVMKVSAKFVFDKLLSNVTESLSNN